MTIFYTYTCQELTWVGKERSKLSGVEIQLKQQKNKWKSYLFNHSLQWVRESLVPGESQNQPVPFFLMKQELAGGSAQM